MAEKDRLKPYGDAMPEMGPANDMAMAGDAATTRAFYSDDPEVEQRAAEGITEGTEGGGICYGCAFFEAPDYCSGYGGDLYVQPDRIVASKAFRPKLEDTGDMGGGMSGGGPAGGMLY